MPVIVKQGLPAVLQLEKEGCFGFKEISGAPWLKIGILNLMPVKERTEADLLRVLSGSPYNIDIDFIETSTYRGTHTSGEHLDTFYIPWTKAKNNRYDGLIITGAPVEEIGYEDVKYWDELCQIMEWGKSKVRSTLYICWAAMAALYHFHDIPKYLYTDKLSGVYRHRSLNPRHRLFRGFDDEFLIPHSRNSFVMKEDILRDRELVMLSYSEDAGVYCVESEKCRGIFVTGHLEYAPETLDYEFKRDLSKGMNPKIPQNYYREDNPDNEIIVRWRAHANLLFSNWVNFYVAPDSFRSDVSD